MRRIIRDQQIVADNWRHLDDEEPLPTGPVTVSWQRWEEQKNALREREGAVGVRIDGDTPIEALPELLDRPLIALVFPVFKDGRCFSHARLLRERHGYEGELRAVGDVLRDQMFYMHRVGINAFEVREDRDLEQALEAFKDFTYAYQAAADQPQRLPQRKRA